MRRVSLCLLLVRAPLEGAASGQVFAAVAGFDFPTSNEQALRGLAFSAVDERVKRESNTSRPGQLVAPSAPPPPALTGEEEEDDASSPMWKDDDGSYSAMLGDEDDGSPVADVQVRFERELGAARERLRQMGIVSEQGQSTTTTIRAGGAAASSFLSASSATPRDVALSVPGLAPAGAATAAATSNTLCPPAPVQPRGVSPARHSPEKRADEERVFAALSDFFDGRRSAASLAQSVAAAIDKTGSITNAMGSLGRLVKERGSCCGEHQQVSVFVGVPYASDMSECAETNRDSVRTAAACAARWKSSCARKKLARQQQQQPLSSGRAGGFLAAPREPQSAQPPNPRFAANMRYLLTRARLSTCSSSAAASYLPAGGSPRGRSPARPDRSRAGDTSPAHSIHYTPISLECDEDQAVWGTWLGELELQTPLITNVFQREDVADVLDYGEKCPPLGSSLSGGGGRSTPSRSRCKRCGSSSSRSSRTSTSGGIGNKNNSSNMRSSAVEIQFLPALAETLNGRAEVEEAGGCTPGSRGPPGEGRRAASANMVGRLQIAQQDEPAAASTTSEAAGAALGQAAVARRSCGGGGRGRCALILLKLFSRGSREQQDAGSAGGVTVSPRSCATQEGSSPASLDSCNDPASRSSIVSVSTRASSSSLRGEGGSPGQEATAEQYVLRTSQVNFEIGVGLSATHWKFVRKARVPLSSMGWAVMIM